jgi:hypothetical protein
MGFTVQDQLADVVSLLVVPAIATSLLEGSCGQWAFFIKRIDICIYIYMI